MHCFICKNKFMSVKFLRGHGISEHLVDGSNDWFRDLFSPNTNSKICHIHELELDNCRMKKNHTFLLHFNQSGGSRMNQLPINILHRPPIKYFIITFEQHKNFYNFYEESVADDFLKDANEKSVPDKECKINGYAQIINSRNNGAVIINSVCTWVNNIFTGLCFNKYIRSKIEKDILKTVIINGETGSSWTFKTYKRLQIIFIPKKNVMDLISSYYLVFLAYLN